MRGLILYYFHLKTQPGTKWPKVLELNLTPKNGPFEPSYLPTDWTYDTTISLTYPWNMGNNSRPV